MFFGLWEDTGTPTGNLHRHNENMQNTHGKEQEHRDGTCDLLIGDGVTHWVLHWIWIIWSEANMESWSTAILTI